MRIVFDSEEEKNTAIKTMARVLGNDDLTCPNDIDVELLDIKCDGGCTDCFKNFFESISSVEKKEV